MKQFLKKIYNLFKVKSPDYYWQIREKAISERGLLHHYYLNKWNKLMRRNNAFIPLNSQFTSKPTFPHGYHGIFISGGAKIGNNCTIFHQVTIGSNTLPDTKNPGAPTIGDNVYIGAGAKIIGGIHIGNNVRIGANCVVSKDIPDNSTVVLPASRVITHTEERNNQFVSWGNNS